MTNLNGHMADTEPLIMVSCDTHFSAALADYRPYCPRAYLSRFNEFARCVEEGELFGIGADGATPMGELVGAEPGSPRVERIAETITAPGGHDMQARLRDLDDDGIAAAVIFHGAMNGNPIPWEMVPFSQQDVGTEFELKAVGRHMYNQLLADLCSTEPERHIALAYLPMWDLEAAIKELEWARSVGFRGVNLPVWQQHTNLLPFTYDDPRWDPFWSACVDLGMVLVNHGGAGSDQPSPNPRIRGFLIHAEGMMAAQKMVGRLVFGGVFERHPELRLVLTEQPTAWAQQLSIEYDELFTTWIQKSPTSEPFSLRLPGLPKLPSEYVHECVYTGASMMAPYEAQDAVDAGWVDNVIWGTDYPHMEGTWQPRKSDDDVPMTHLALRNTFGGLAEHDIRLMVGENAIRFYGLDREALGKIAGRINAPSIDDVSTPLPVDEIPEVGSPLAFRQNWYRPKAIFTRRQALDPAKA